MFWREIDFANEKVRTLAGNGTKGSDYIGGGKGDTQVIKLICKFLRMSDIRILYSYNLRWTTIFFKSWSFTSYMISLGSLMDHKLKILDFLPFSAP